MELVFCGRSVLHYDAGELRYLLLQSHAPEGVPELYSAAASQRQRKTKDAFESFSQICIRVVTTKLDVSALHVLTNL